MTYVVCRLLGLKGKGKVMMRIKLTLWRALRFAERHDDETGESFVHHGMEFVTEHLPHLIGSLGHG